MNEQLGIYAGDDGSDKGYDKSITKSSVYTDNITITDSKKQELLTGKNVEETLKNIKADIDKNTALS